MDTCYSVSSFGHPTDDDDNARLGLYQIYYIRGNVVTLAATTTAYNTYKLQCYPTVFDRYTCVLHIWPYRCIRGVYANWRNAPGILFSDQYVRSKCYLYIYIYIFHYYYYYYYCCIVYTSSTTSHQ